MRFPGGPSSTNPAKKEGPGEGGGTWVRGPESPLLLSFRGVVSGHPPAPPGPSWSHQRPPGSPPRKTRSPSRLAACTGGAGPAWGAVNPTPTPGRGSEGGFGGLGEEGGDSGCSVCLSSSPRPVFTCRPPDFSQSPKCLSKCAPLLHGVSWGLAPPAEWRFPAESPAP